LHWQSQRLHFLLAAVRLEPELYQASHIIVPYAPGSTPTSSHALSDRSSDAIGQPVIVENKPSSSGNIGADFVAAPDGHTLLITGRHARDQPIW
jgi:tripartite-type tricarboxylate transporter receptor subunit TctC